MKKTTNFKIVLLFLVLILAVGCLFACGKKSTYTVTFMDGDTVLSRKSVEPGNAVTLPQPTKDGYSFVGWYTDTTLESAYVDDSEVNDNLVLYAKFARKALSIAVNSDGGTAIEKISVTTGSEYTVPTPEKEGYTFVGFTYINENNDELYFAQTGTYTLKTNVRLTAKWQINTYNVVFKDANGTTIETQPVQYGQKANKLVSEGYTIEGYYDNAEFEGEKIDLSTFIVRENTEIFVNRTANVYRITVVGWSQLSCDVTYGEEYDISVDENDDLYLAKIGTSVDNEWTDFLGFVMNNEPFTATGVYMWARNITVTAVGTLNNNYQKAMVTFIDGIDHGVIPVGEEDGLIINKGQSIALADFPNVNDAHAGYTFAGWFTTPEFAPSSAYTGGVVDGSFAVYAKFAPNSYVITCDGEEFPVTFGEAYELPTDKFGYTFGGYTYNNEEFDAVGTYTIPQDITISVTWTPLENSSKKYFVEDNTYIFLKGITYNFKSQSLSSSSNSVRIFAEGGDNKFEALSVSDSFTLVVDESDVNCKIVEYVNTINLGSDFQSMISNGTNNNVYQITTSQSEYVLDAGYNNFKPDIAISNLTNNYLTLEEANVELLIYDENENLLDSDYTLDGNVITLDSDLVDTEIKIVFQPKYALSADNLTFPSMKVKVNDGVNVYTSLELRTNYANLSVSKINILRNITAQLLEEDYASGYGSRGNVTLDIEGSMGTEHVTLENIDTGVPKNNFGKGVYTRHSAPNGNDNIVINGNYFTIDGSKLPYIDPSDKAHRTSGVGYDLANVQIGIFLYRCLQTEPGTNPNTTYDDQEYRSNNGHATFNNLRISGNNIYSAQATQSGVTDNPFLKMSSSYIGMIFRGGTIKLDNVSIVKNSMGMMLHGGVSGYYLPGLGGIYGGSVASAAQPNEEVAVKLDMSNCIISNAWSNDIYAYDLAAVKLTNTKLNGCSGAAIHFDNRPYGGGVSDSCGYSNLNSSLTMDIYTGSNINNWVAGTEPWFVAYGRADQAALIKQGFEGSVSGNSGGMLTVLKEEKNVEMMNFAILVFPTETNSNPWAADNGGPAHIDTTILPQAQSAGLNVFYSLPEDAATLQAFQDGYAAAYAAGGEQGATLWAMGQFVSYGAMAFDGSSGMGLYLPVYVK